MSVRQRNPPQPTTLSTVTDVTDHASTAAAASHPQTPLPSPSLPSDRGGGGVSFSTTWMTPPPQFTLTTTATSLALNPPFSSSRQKSPKLCASAAATNNTTTTPRLLHTHRSSPRSSPNGIFRTKLAASSSMYSRVRLCSVSSLTFVMGSCFAALMISSILLQRSLSDEWSSAATISTSPSSLVAILASSNKTATLRRALEQHTILLSSVPTVQPRVVYIDGRWLPGSGKRRFLDPALTMMTSVNTSVDDIEHWQSPHNMDGEDQCIPKAAWQTYSYPNCNSLHELNVALSLQQQEVGTMVTTKERTNENELSILGEGWFRTTWRWDRFHGSVEPRAESVVLKTLRMEREFLSEYYELHRRDAVAMERLTSSPFVVSVFGFCGQSAINELADFPFPGVQSLESFNRRMRGKESVKTNTIKLRMAASIAQGLADIHAAGMITNAETNDGGIKGAYMAHYDLNPRNIALFTGGRPKINDFNIAEFLHYNPRTNETCKFPSRLHEPWWRAPEEMNTTHTEWVDEKVDVYALGNVLFHTLTTHSARGKQHKSRMAKVRPIVAAGIRPIIPDHYRKSDDPNVIAIVKAINLCWSKDPNRRATSKEVAAHLYEALKNRASAEADSVEETPADADSKQDDDGPGSSSGEDKEALGHESTS